MKYEDKKALYESIMKDLAKIVHKYLFESIDKSNEAVAEIPYCTAVDNIVFKVINNFKEKIKELPTEEIAQAFSAVYKKAKRHIWPSDDRELQVEMRQYDMHGMCLESINPFNSIDFENLKKKLIRAHNLKDWQFQVINPFNLDTPDINFLSYYDMTEQNDLLFSLIISNAEENGSIVERELRNNGYYVIRKGVMNISSDQFDGEVMTTVCFIFTKLNTKDVRPEIEKFKYLYHISLRCNRADIIENGLIAEERNGEGGIFYPERVFFFCGNCKQEAIEYSAQIAEGYGEDVDLYTIDISKMKSYGSNIQLHYDPLIGNTAVYCDCDVPAEAIVKIEEL